MELGIQGKVAMVAAASKGLGKAVAEALAREGCHVSICARTRGDLDRAVDDLGSVRSSGKDLAVVADVTEPAELARWHAETVAELGPVGILVTNTGGPPAAPFSELTEDEWRAGVESTLLNVVRLSHLVLPGMRAHRWGRIVHLTSRAAKEPDLELTLSSTLRAGLSALTKAQADELAPHGITVNAVLPGNVETDRQVALNTKLARKRGIPYEEQVEQARRRVPLGRFGKPREIGDVVAFLCSERASYVTGTSLQVDGGLARGTF